MKEPYPDSQSRQGHSIYGYEDLQGLLLGKRKELVDERQPLASNNMTISHCVPGAMTVKLSASFAAFLALVIIHHT